MRMMFAIAAMVGVGLGSVASAREAGPWTALNDFSDAVKAGDPWVRPDAYRAFRGDLATLRTVLARAPMQNTPAAIAPLTFQIPTPDGDFASFAIVESPVMEPELTAKFPDIRSYAGQGIDDPASNVRLDISPLGFRAQVLAPDGRSWSIDPYTRNVWDEYAVYEIRSLAGSAPEWTCHVRENEPPTIPGYTERATGQTLRTYRLAVAATPTYTNFFNGTVAGALSGINTTVNRLTQVYTNEFAVAFTLVANNNLIIYTNGNPGPYTDGDLGLMLDENQTNLTTVIGTANYNIGHVVCALNTGGLAQLRALCSATGKARGGTGLSSPTGDFFTVKYMGHELGHQFGGSHSFNADDSAGGNVCLPNRSGSNAYEVGSGSTIMSYQGLCGGSNNLDTWDVVFNQGAYAQITAHITGAGNCGTNTNTGNTAPSVNAGVDRTIPKGTPFTMTCTATDINNDTMTYSWEQRDLGAAQPAIGAGSADNGTSPIFRVFPATASASRTFPRMVDVLDGVVTLGEQYPAVARTLDLRVTVRDNRSGAGGVNFDDVVVNINGTAGPFQVTSPNTNVSWDTGSAQTITWSVAGTNVAPINTANVRILLSTDGGSTFPITLSASTPNDGSEAVMMPVTPTNAARVRIEAINNVYFDISNTNFAITCVTPDFPTGTSATDDRCDQVNVAWTGVAGATMYEVYRNTTSSTIGGTLIGTTAGTTFADTTATAGVTFFYRVKAGNGGCVGPFSNFDSGRRGVGPAITSPPAGASVSIGQNAMFSVGATGEPLAYRWRKDGIDLTDGGRVSGATTASLTIANVEAGDAGAYSVRLSSVCGTLISGSATLSIQGGCVADVDDGSGTGTPDGGVTIDDLLYYLFIFENGFIAADVDDGSATGTPDGGVTIDDLLYYLFRFESGC